jgi:hypothetical protein
MNRRLSIEDQRACPEGAVGAALDPLHTPAFGYGPPAICVRSQPDHPLPAYVIS